MSISILNMAFPVYLLAYIDKSTELNANPVKIGVFLILVIGFGVCRKILGRRYDEYLKTENQLFV